MQLTYEQRQSIYRDGFVKVPGVVPRSMVNEALKAINHSVGQGMNVSEMTTFRAQSFCPEIRQSSAITDLLNKTPAWDLAESAIGQGNIRKGGNGQIALRFPLNVDRPSKPRCHLDGMHSPTNGVPAGQISNFSMLVGVLLSDLPDINAGNFTVWPGSHHLFEKYFREHGPESLLAGMPPVDLPGPKQITGQAGDVVLCHYQLAHGIAPNVSPHIRYAVFFRLKHIDHNADWKAPMTDIWLHWPGVREVLEPDGEGKTKHNG